MQSDLSVWHRSIGLVAALFIIFLVVTGIVIQHSNALNLPVKYLSNSWLLHYYGIKPNPITSFDTGEQVVSHAGETIYLSGNPIPVKAETLHGAVVLHGDIVIATSDLVLVCNSIGQVVDEITVQDGLHELPLGIALTEHDTVVIRGASTHWEADTGLATWYEFRKSDPRWMMPSTTPPNLKEMIEVYDMSSQISWERFLLDLHSGRFLGRYGVYVIDAAGILILILSLTGLVLWTTRR
ncbi:MAG: PepSY domain-containing protein [Proteobacteria bacterium]|nr:PepSY domain-containing protein [Pseudomonadota bacterium]